MECACSKPITLQVGKQVDCSAQPWGGECWPQLVPGGLPEGHTLELGQLEENRGERHSRLRKRSVRRAPRHFRGLECRWEGHTARRETVASRGSLRKRPREEVCLCLGLMATMCPTSV